MKQLSPGSMSRFITRRKPVIVVRSAGASPTRRGYNRRGVVHGTTRGGHSPRQGVREPSSTGP